MAITYVSTVTRQIKHITWERLAEIHGMSVNAYKKDYDKKFGSFKFDCRPFAEGIKCPFGERDLMNDTCYMGNGFHRCPYFKRYIHDRPHINTIECCCPKPKVVGVPIQLELFV